MTIISFTKEQLEKAIENENSLAKFNYNLEKITRKNSLKQISMFANHIVEVIETSTSKEIDCYKLIEELRIYCKGLSFMDELYNMKDL